MTMFAKRLSAVMLLSMLLALLAACGETTTQPTSGTGTSGQPTTAASNLGTAENPIKMYFVPSGEVDQVLASGDKIAAHLEEATGLVFETEVPTSYAAVIEALGSNQADVAWLATFAYVLAHDKYGAEVELTTLRDNEATYVGAIFAAADSGITTIEGCDGKTVAWTDPASTSGYVYPSGLFSQKGIEPAEELFAGGHPQAILAVYEGNADCAASYFSPEQDGVIQDGRARLLETHPDVAEKVAIIGYTDEIPNDTVTFRKDFPEDAKIKIIDALMAYSETEEGKTVLDELYSIDGFVKSDDSRYDIVRTTLESLGKKPEDLVK